MSRFPVKVASTQEGAMDGLEANIAKLQCGDSAIGAVDPRRGGNETDSEATDAQIHEAVVLET